MAAVSHLASYLRRNREALPACRMSNAALMFRRSSMLLVVWGGDVVVRGVAALMMALRQTLLADVRCE